MCPLILGKGKMQLSCLLLIVEPLIMDPPRKEYCMLDLSITDIAQGPKNYYPYRH